VGSDVGNDERRADQAIERTQNRRVVVAVEDT